MKLLNPWVLLGILALSGSAYGVGQYHGRGIEKGKQAEKTAIIEDVRNAAMQSAALAISEIKIENTTVRQELEREIRTVVDYSQCRNSPDGMSAINRALRAEPAGDSKLSDADAAR